MKVLFYFVLKQMKSDWEIDQSQTPWKFCDRKDMQEDEGRIDGLMRPSRKEESCRAEEHPTSLQATPPFIEPIQSMNRQHSWIFLSIQLCLAAQNPHQAILAAKKSAQKKAFSKVVPIRVFSEWFQIEMRWSLF